MSTERTTAATVAMKSGGYYSERTRGAKDVIDNATGMLLDAVAALPEPDGQRALQIADFGAADGGTSKQAIGQTVRALRQRFSDRQVLVTYTDLPSNDFSTLFKAVQGLDGAGESTYFTENDGIFVHACGVGFHRQLLPDQSLDIGFSATAMHYISEKPMEIPDHVHMVGASGEILQAYTERARRDWENILLARARELRPGGRLVLLNFGIDEEGRYLGATGGVNMFETFWQLWQDLHRDGLITETEVTNASFAQFYRTKEAFTAPLISPESPVYQAGLRLKSARTAVYPCPYRKAFDDAQGRMSPREFAKSYIPTLRSWSETVFATALSPARDPEERRNIVDTFYQRYEDLVAGSPDGHAMDYVHCYIAAEKQ